MNAIVRTSDKQWVSFRYLCQVSFKYKSKKYNKIDGNEFTYIVSIDKYRLFKTKLK